MSCYMVKVKFEVTDDKGRVKNQTRKYIVEGAASVTDAEAIMVGYLKDSLDSYYVAGVDQLGIEKIINKDSK